MNSLDRSKANRLVLSATLLPTAFQPIQPASGRINCKKFVASWAEDDECNKRETSFTSSSEKTYMSGKVNFKETCGIVSQVNVGDTRLQTNYF